MGGQTIDVDALRSYLLDYCGTAMMNGFPAALIDVGEVDSASPADLLAIAERLGVDVSHFVTDD